MPLCLSSASDWPAGAIVLLETNPFGKGILSVVLLCSFLHGVTIFDFSNYPLTAVLPIHLAQNSLTKLPQNDKIKMVFLQPNLIGDLSVLCHASSIHLEKKALSKWFLQCNCTRMWFLFWYTIGFGVLHEQAAKNLKYTYCHCRLMWFNHIRISLKKLSC